MKYDWMLTSFRKGALAGVVALVFNFILRLGGLAPFPPESALEAYLRIIPESIQEPAVQQLGDFAGTLGLIVASLVAVAVYGALGILFEVIYAQRVRAAKSITSLEKFLLYSIVPWIFFGLVVLPISGSSAFGVSASFASGSAYWLFPSTLLVSQLVFSGWLSYEYRESQIMMPSKENALSAQKETPEPSASRKISRRTFVERGVVVIVSLALVATSLESYFSSLSLIPSALPSGTAMDPQDAPPIFQDTRLHDLLYSEVTSNEAFYRVSISIIDPSVDASSWALQLTGLVGTPKTYSLSDLQRLPQTEEYDTFECVSNVVNGNLISNAKWTGVKLSDLFNDVGGLGLNAKYVVFYSVDGYSVGIPVSRALMPESMLAHEMNDESLPQAHGYPLRAVIPGLYGMMSAKWLRKIEVVDSVYEGYWQTRGWSNDGTVETLAFITVPGDGASLSQYGGSVILGGVAYAGDRGISKVEVSLDGGKTWQPAQLKKPISNLTWTLWAFDWHPSKTGNYAVYARATDGAGQVQTSQARDTFPDGATGYAVINVNVVS